MVSVAVVGSDYKLYVLTTIVDQSSVLWRENAKETLMNYLQTASSRPDEDWKLYDFDPRLPTRISVEQQDEDGVWRMLPHPDHKTEAWGMSKKKAPAGKRLILLEQKP